MEEFLIYLTEQERNLLQDYGRGGKIMADRVYGPIKPATLVANYWGPHHTDQGIDQRRIDHHNANYVKPRPPNWWTWHDEEDNCPIADPPELLT